MQALYCACISNISAEEFVKLASGRGRWVQRLGRDLVHSGITARTLPVVRPVAPMVEAPAVKAEPIKDCKDPVWLAALRQTLKKAEVSTQCFLLTEFQSLLKDAGSSVEIYPTLARAVLALASDVPDALGRTEASFYGSVLDFTAARYHGGAKRGRKPRPRI